jgi:phosphatidate phosphatase PAH1
MNKTAIVVCLILSISFANAGFLKNDKKEIKKETVITQLQDMEKHEFGKKILDTITLQLKNNSPMSDIARMLAEIRQDLTLQNHEADNIHASQVLQCTTQITEFNRRIDVATVQREDAEGEISILSAEIANLRADIAIKSKQLEILDNREQTLREEREHDAFAYAARTAQTEEVIGALEMILERLSGI